ncbi:hypothetical protein ACWC2M_35270 [Streptomyces sp. NPDC001761]
MARKHGEIAQLLQKESDASLTAADRFWLWSALAEAWASICVAPETSDIAVLNAVEGGAIEAEIMSTEEFTFEQFRHSEEIDLDHISSPLPL